MYGEISLKTQVYKRANGSHFQRALDPSVDGSGWTPIALERMLDLSARLTFEESACICTKWGIKVSSSELERITQKASGALQEEVEQQLKQESLSQLSEGQGRMMTLQMDGVYVLEQAKAGGCGGIEIKSTLISPVNSPSEKTMLAGVYTPSQLLVLVSGLLRLAKVRVNDRLIGLSDGAIWIEQLFATLGIEHIIDVYHALLYLDVLLEALGWSEDERKAERQLWSKGLVNARDWLAVYAVLLRQQQQPEGVVTALAYFEARVDKMDYAKYTAQGIPIGSGRVEAMNKAVIGSRMKLSGMHWSRCGASRMALLRSQVRSTRPIAAPVAVRFSAFPLPF
jgi:hypothetical protein